MKKLALLTVLICLLVIGIAIPTVRCTFEGSEGDDAWLHKLTQAKQKVTRLHFFFHDTLSGPNPSAIRIAKSNMTDKSHTLFGAVYMFDDALTSGPEPTSEEVGRAQGLYGSAGQQELGLLMAMELTFTSGRFNGSTLSVLGRNPALRPVREMPIVGGTGPFRLARGFVTAKTYLVNFPSGDAVVEYNVVVIHY